jgi:hypothetical protein
MDDDTARIDRIRADFDEFVEHVRAVTFAYVRASHDGHERAGRRFLIAGLRVMTLRFVGKLVVRRPCWTFEFTVAASWKNYHRARRRLLDCYPDAPATIGAVTARS